MKGFVLVVVAVVLLASVVPVTGAEGQSGADIPKYKNTSLPFDVRAADLVSRMTLEEKISQTNSTAPAIPRLGVPAYHWGNECLHGVMADGFTVFPQSIGIGASWDTDLLYRITTAISDEARASYNQALKKGEGLSKLNFWSPNINIARDPRWGRNQETYGEDPYLTSRMAVSYVKGLQGDDSKYIKVISTPKHFAVHSGPEPLRHAFDAKASNRDMWDTYFPAFEASIKEAGAWSVMGAYNRTNGVPCCASELLLENILRKKWGFKGYVVSDCGAIENIWLDHKVQQSPEEAAASAVKAGCDLACFWDSYSTLGNAVAKGLISEKDIDKAVIRLMEARMRLGMFDPPEMVKYSKLTPDVIHSDKHKDLALEAARKSIVLLKNQNNMLPLDKSKIKTAAVIGPCADIPQLGDYTGTPADPVTILKGIRDKLGPNVQVLYDKGCEMGSGLTAIPSSVLTPAGGDGKQHGLKGEYFANHEMTGEPVLVRVDESVDFMWGTASPAPELNGDYYSVRWTGKLTAPVTGRYAIGTYADDGVRLYVDGKLIIDNWIVTPATSRVSYVDMEAGKSYDIKLEYYEQAGQAVACLRWSTPESNDGLSYDALDLARKSDVVFLVLGTPSRSELRGIEADIVEDEGVDRFNITLSGLQEKLMKAVCSVGKPVVLLLTGGSTISVPWASEHVPAIVETWFGGESGGTAVADVLFGDYNPAGRLPMTCYTGLDQVPDFENYSMEGRTYRYFKGTPLYPFGFGLSYTTFRYSALKLDRDSVKAGESITVNAEVQNTGSKAGDEVVQLYLSDIEASAPVPIRKLIGFQRITLAPGEKKQVSFTISPASMAFVDNDGNRILEPGKFKITLGGSQGDNKSIQLGAAPVLSGEFNVTGKILRLE